MKHKLTEKDEAKGGKDSHMHHHKHAMHHMKEMKHHMSELAKMAKQAHKHKEK